MITKRLTGKADVPVEWKKTTVRMPDTLKRAVRSKAADYDITLEKVTNSLLALWVKKGPGKIHIDIRPDGDIVLMTPEEIETELQKMKRR